MTKTCIKCGGMDFTKSMKCRACRKAIAASYRERNAEKVRASAAKYRSENLAKCRASSKKSKALDIDRERARQTKWREENKEAMKNMVADWNRRNPQAGRLRAQNRRARTRAAGGKLSKDLFQRLFKLQRGKCICCRVSFLKSKPHLDHIVALKNGGAHDDLNIQLLCQPCNNAKHVKEPLAFMQSRGFLI